MDGAARAELERAVREALAARAVERATELVLRGHGPEILRFLSVVTGDVATAADAFSLFAEGVWRGLPRFDWACSLRTWTFAIARRSALRLRRDHGRRRAHEVALDAHPELAAVAAEVRTRTLSFLRTERRSRLAELRTALPEDERALLSLRVDQRLGWLDCARALADGDAPLEGDELKRAAARLRKRFQLLRERLVAAGRREGLLGGEQE